MFIFLNKIVKGKFSPRQGIKERPAPPKAGQVAVILILVIAIGLVFFAVTFNFGRISQVKTLIMMASGNAASLMGSFMMSYGESVFRTQLDGDSKICKTTSVMTAIIALIMVIVAIIIMVLTYSAGAAKAVYLIALAIIMLTAAIVNLILQVSVIQPGITDMWNKAVSDSMPMPDQFIEYGASTGMRGAVTDQVQVPDFFDMDSDGVFGAPWDPANGWPPPPGLKSYYGISAPDYVSRLGYYMLKRVNRLGDPKIQAISDFKAALSEFLYAGSDNWGLYDNSVNCAAMGFPSICNPCCVDWAVIVPDLPACCRDPSDPNYSCIDDYPLCQQWDCCINDNCPNGASTTTCAANSPYNMISDTYPDIYDFYYDNPMNTFFSLREQIGRDDEHHLYLADRNAPGETGPQILDPAPLAPPDPNRFKLEDTTGFYAGPVYTTPPVDNRAGIFPFFYKIQDWGTELSALTYANEECHWCNSNVATGGAACPSPPAPLPQEIPQLSLLNNPNNPAFRYGGGQCVDNVNTGIPDVNEPPQVLDKVTGPANPASPIADIFENPNNCALGDLAPIDAGWKRGADRFCSTTWPYDEGCAKHGSTCTITWSDGTTAPADCECGEEGTPANNGSNWQDDNLDQIVYGLGKTFFPWAELIANGQDLALTTSFASWYDEAADWIEPYCPPPCLLNGCPGQGCCSCAGSYTKKQRPLNGVDGGPPGGGRLWIVRDQLRSFYDPIFDWIYPSAGNEYVGGSCAISSTLDSVWCVPPAQGAANEYGINECSGVNAQEAVTFDFNSNGIRGDLEDVVECLNWNANDPLLDAVGGAVLINSGPHAGSQVIGNALKFEKCAEDCNVQNCAALPRSLLPTFSSVLPFDPGSSAVLQTCLNSTSLAECNTNCDQPPLPSGPPYNLPVFTPADLVQVTRLTDGTVAGICAVSPPGTILPGECDTDNPAGPNIDCDSATLAADLAACACSWEQSCSGWGCVVDTVYYDAVNAALSVTGGSCADIAPGGFIDLVTQSAVQAENQVAKMRKRYNFLGGRLNEAKIIVEDDPRNPNLNDGGVIGGAINKLTAFLDNGTPWNTPGPGPNGIPGDFDDTPQDSPAEGLIDARISKASAPALSSFIIYAWQDILDAPRQRPGYLAPSLEGYWHIVKAEVRMPGRCNAACGHNPDFTGSEAWPGVDTYTKGFLRTTRCYEFENHDGIVKARVTRYDEDLDSTEMKFSSGSSIWSNIRLFHPDKTRKTPFGVNLAANCLQEIDIKLRVAPLGSTTAAPWANAFMLNKIAHVGFDPAYDACWDSVHELLETGVNSETCVKYWFDDASSNFLLDFINCDQGFKDGTN